MAITKGVAYTGAIEEGLIEVDVSDIISMLEPDITPLITIITTANKKPTETPDYVYWEKDALGFFLLKTAAAVDNVTTIIPLVDASGVTVNNVLRVPSTGEVMKVTAVSGNNITVIRGWSEVEGDPAQPLNNQTAAIPAGSEILIIGDAFQEGSAAPEVLRVQAVKKTNCTQIVKTTYGVSGTMESTRLYTGPDITQQDLEAMMRHKLKMENIALFSKYKVEVDASGKVTRATRGILSTLLADPQVVKYDAGNLPLTETAFENFLREGFKYGSPKKILVCSPLVAENLSMILRDKVRIVKDTSTYGIAVKRWENAVDGSVDIIVHKKLIGETYGKMAILIDTKYLYYRPLAGNNKSRDTKLIQNIQMPNMDEIQHQYITEFGIQLELARCHGLLYNVGIPS